MRLLPFSSEHFLSVTIAYYHFSRMLEGCKLDVVLFTRLLLGSTMLTRNGKREKAATPEHNDNMISSVHRASKEVGSFSSYSLSTWILVNVTVSTKLFNGPSIVLTTNQA